MIVLFVLGAFAFIGFMMLAMDWVGDVKLGRTEDTLRIRMIKAVKWLW